MTLFYTTPLIFTGLAVALPFQAGLFNIGAEGQLIMGAMAATATGLMLPGLPPVIAPLLAGCAAFCGGAAWAAIAGWLRARRGAHEVITTIMLNFIAAGLTSYLTLYVFRNFDTQNPETRPLGASYLLGHFAFLGNAPVSAALVVALVVAVFVSILIRRTVVGYRIRAVGQSESVALANGIDASRMRLWAMTLAGGIAGLVGVAEVLGNSGKFKMEFSPGYGFIGIAVALLGRGQPLGVVLSALLFGALHKGAADLDLETQSVTRDVSSILQACIILSVASRGLWVWMKHLKRDERGSRDLGGGTR
jgi:simple sugar transport system permease protein